jgi:hypothetical protein
MGSARFALHGGGQGVLCFCLHISDFLFGKNRSGFEREIAEDTEKGTLRSVCCENVIFLSRGGDLRE